jgi:hypothetical protein
VIQSEPLQSQSWTKDLPVNDDTDGEWRWTVSVMLNGKSLVTSSEWMFWFRPFGDDSGNGKIETIPPPPTPE